MSRIVSMVLAVVLASSLVSCGGPGATTGTDEALPDWIVSVFPEPNSHSAFSRIQVVFPASFTPREPSMPGAEGIRLMIDRVDVTSYARVTPRQITYDAGGRGGQQVESQFEQPQRDVPAPVQLDPGPHVARVERVYLPEIGADLQVRDHFEWTFEVQ